MVVGGEHANGRTCQQEEYRNKSSHHPRPTASARSEPCLHGDVLRPAHPVEQLVERHVVIDREVGARLGDVLADLLDQLVPSRRGCVAQRRTELIEIALDDGVLTDRRHQERPPSRIESTFRLNRVHCSWKRPSASFPSALRR